MSRIAITPGEPAGIGPELLIQLVQQQHQVELVAIADPDLLTERARLLGLPLILHDYNPLPESISRPAGALTVLPVALAAPASCGKLDTNNAAYVLACLDRAVDGCQSGEFSAMVTGPVHKGIINDAGISFSGHTEYLAQRTGTDQVVMMLTTRQGRGVDKRHGRQDSRQDPGNDLRVALATTHLPLSQVSRAITPQLLEKVLHILHDSLQQQFGLSRPRILVCGLNPHAGEQGHLGMEEITIIEPVIHKLQQQGMDLHGPLPADTLFTPPRLEKADAVLAMYHDQGLPVLKYKGFGEAVNITLGLPIIRTSVDHGTALELAGSGKASCSSLEAALQAATDMSQVKLQQSA